MIGFSANHRNFSAESQVLVLLYSGSSHCFGASSENLLPLPTSLIQEHTFKLLPRGWYNMILVVVGYRGLGRSWSLRCRYKQGERDNVYRCPSRLLRPEGKLDFLPHEVVPFAKNTRCLPTSSRSIPRKSHGENAHTSQPASRSARTKVESTAAWERCSVGVLRGIRRENICDANC